MLSPFPVPRFEDVLAAAARIAPHAHATPVHRSHTLDALAGCELHFKGEHLQRGGAFKFRGACNAVWSLGEEQAARGVVTHSSGNHGAALALAARTRGIACHVVVPDNASPAKAAAIEAYGGVLHRCQPTQAAREAACQALQESTGAELVHPSADARVIAGQGTAALELIGSTGPLDALVVPVSGGGLASGSAITLAGVSPATRLFLAEPAAGADAAASFERGERATELVADTICDGLRATIGAPNFGILQAAGAKVLTVEDDDTLVAMRLLWQRLKQVVEPSSAIAFAAVLGNPALFAGSRVGVVLSGGNVAPEVLRMAGAQA
ncbi:MAG: pyridoxal-phosphate dependent enzyme [Gammaproteobacteria bacterium]|nr:pyridoxal-phosphate dependent enzyme [Gammaproteobacteria bacterium]